MTIDKNALQILETLTRMINSAYKGTLINDYGTEHMLIFENIMELAENISYEDFMEFYNNNSSFYKIHLCDIIQQEPTAETYYMSLYESVKGYLRNPKRETLIDTATLLKECSEELYAQAEYLGECEAEKELNPTKENITRYKRVRSNLRGKKEMFRILCKYLNEDTKKYFEICSNMKSKSYSLCMEKAKGIE